MKAYAVPAPTGAAELLARAQSGEREAFTELVERHHPELVRIASAVTGNLEAARDAAQAAWLKAWQRLPSVREPDRLRNWLVAIAAHPCLSAGSYFFPALVRQGDVIRVVTSSATTWRVVMYSCEGCSPAE